MGRKNNNPRQSGPGTTTKPMKPVAVGKRNVKIQNKKETTSSKNSNGANILKPRDSSCSNMKNGCSPIAFERSIGAANVKDRSQLNFPYDIRINGLSSMLNTVNKSTPKVRKLLLDECDLIMECKFCRNLFRSVPNFLSHKQNYCKLLYHPSSENGCSPVLPSGNRSSSNGIKYQLDTTSIDHLQQSITLSDSLSSNYCPQEDNVDLDTGRGIVVDDGVTRTSSSLYSAILERTKEAFTSPLNSEEVKLVIEPIDNRRDLVVFQRRFETDPSICDSSNPIHNTREVVDRDTAILGPDGKVICTGTEIGIERIVKRLTAEIQFCQQKMVQDSTNQLEEKCDICKTVFNTEKALRQHRRDAPDCVKQSVIKLSQGTSNNGKFAPKSTVNQVAGVSVAETKLCDPISAAEHSKLKEDKAKSSLFVKKLFSKSSPLKGMNSIQSPSKSSMFTKKLLSGNSSVTSPFKTLGKAKKLKTLSDNKLTAKNKVLSPVKKRKGNNDLTQSQFSCIKCSSKFRTIGDMSMHFERCTGVINLSLLKNSFPSDDKKICIEVRHCYSKPAVTKLPKATEPEKCNIKEKSSVETPINSSPTLILSDSLKKVVNLSKKELFIDTIKTDLKSKVTPSPNRDADNLTSDPRELVNSCSTSNTIEIPELETMSEIDNSSIDGLPGFIREVDSSNGSSGSEIDRESISNVTDSGVSSSTTPSEGHPDIHSDLLPVSPTDLQALSIPSTSSDLIISKARSKKNSNPEDRVLTPKNKNHRLTDNSRKRKSSRIQLKDIVVKKLPRKK